MDARGLVRSVRMVGTAWRERQARTPWGRRRSDGVARPVSERARVPGPARGAQARPGGGMIWFERSSLCVRVAVGGAVFLGWDGAEPTPSYALAAPVPEPDGRAELEPDKAGGWRVVSERLLVTVSRHGAVEIRTPGGELLRRELPPRWWESVTPGDERGPGEEYGDGDGPYGPRDGDGGVAAEAQPAGSAGRARWLQRSEVAADARFFGLGARAGGPPLRNGSYRLWNADQGPAGPDADPLPVTMPLQLVVADVGTHLIFHDNSWDGRVTITEGVEGRGSGHDRHGRSETRMDGGPLRYWVIAGPPARVLHGWARLSGSPALPPGWALGHQHSGSGTGTEDEVRATAAAYRERGLPLRAVHLGAEHQDGNRVFTVDAARFPDLPSLAAELRTDGVRLVSVVDPAVRPEPGNAVHDSGAAVDAFVRDERGRQVLGVLRRPGKALLPDFTEPRVRKWWGELYAERLAQGFAGVSHDLNEPSCQAVPGGERTLPRLAQHALEGRGGDHREAHNVYALTMAQAGHAGLRHLRPSERPFLVSRSGWAGMQRHGGTWSGELVTDWAGLRASLALVVGLGLCGVPYSGPDIGGGTAVPSPELYLRWFQLAAYLPLFRTRATKGAGSPVPWAFGEQVLADCSAAMAERERLRPYFSTLAQLAHRTGAPYVRPLWWQHPRDRALRECDDAFLLGDALLVAPVLEAGARRRTVQLPHGRWYDTATGEAHEGPGEAQLNAPLSRVPVLARAGAAVPVTGPDGSTELEVWPPAPGRKGSGLVIPDEGEGWGRALPERFTVGLDGGTTVVTRQDGGAVGYPVRVRT
ncbi:glycoside hydrolase family 31 protein [Streptomyces ovatisporus]|uniref:Glycoside hydrolase family 31 protein n=1 Tax=Streptomyces ovatisporus TaxID=1128682 RepID=A0ABV9AB27_9ACTN